MIDGAVSGIFAADRDVLPGFLRHEVGFAIRVGDENVAQRLGAHVGDMVRRYAPVALDQCEYRGN